MDNNLALLTALQVEKLAMETNVSIEKFRHIWAYERFSELRVKDLKALISWLKSAVPAFRYSPHLKCSGRKEELVENLRRSILQVKRPFTAQQQPQQLFPRRKMPAYAHQQFPIRSLLPNKPSPSPTYGRIPHQAARPSVSEADLLQSMINHPEYRAEAVRNPVFQYLILLDKRVLNINRRAELRFSIPSPYLGTKLATPNNPHGQYKIHMRLFCRKKMKQVPWLRHMFRVGVNNSFPTVPDARKYSKTSTNAQEYIRPLDITNFVRPSNAVDVLLLSQNDPFDGMVTVEVEEKVPSTTLIRKVLQQKGRPVEAQPIPECPVCGLKKELLRCSRCKVAWYCSSEHQHSHWAKHKLTCQPPQDKKVEVPDDDDAVVEVNSKLSLVCPLSLTRIVTPVKGVDCDHETCFDLDSYLSLCGQSYLWQCPLCFIKLPLENLRVDKFLQEILACVEPTVNQVRLSANNQYSPIHEDDSLDDPDSPPPSKRRKTSSRSGNEDGATFPSSLSEPPSTGSTLDDAIEISD